MCYEDGCTCIAKPKQVLRATHVTRSDQIGVAFKARTNWESVLIVALVTDSLLMGTEQRESQANEGSKLPMMHIVGATT